MFDVGELEGMLMPLPPPHERSEPASGAAPVTAPGLRSSGRYPAPVRGSSSNGFRYIYDVRTGKLIEVEEATGAGRAGRP
jgi:hypothetical protein